jgi:hypothetical protein
VTVEAHARVMSGPERHAILIVRVTVRPGEVAGECRTDVVVTSSADLRSRRLIRVRPHCLDDVATIVRTRLAEWVGLCASGDGTLTPRWESGPDEGRSP